MDFPIFDQPGIRALPSGLANNGGGTNGIKWTSKYASLVIKEFTALGYEDIVSEGVNEKGLAAHLLYYGDTELPSNKSKNALHLGLWVQYLLDMAS